MERETIKAKKKDGVNIYNLTHLVPPTIPIEESRLREKLKVMMEENHLSYQFLGNVLGVHKSTLWKFMNEDWQPKRKRLRQAFGLSPYPQVDIIRQVRAGDGTFEEETP